MLGGRLQAIVEQAGKQGVRDATSIKIPQLSTSLTTSSTNIFGTGSRGLPTHGRGAAVLNQPTRAAALPATQVATKLQPDTLPLTRIDEVGAISIVEPNLVDFQPTVFENIDGRRIEDGRYAAFAKEISGVWCRRWGRTLWWYCDLPYLPSTRCCQGASPPSRGMDATK